MTLRHVWSLLCLRSVVDSDSNMLSVFDVLEEVRVKPHVAKKEGLAKGGGVLAFTFEWVTLWARMQREKPSSGHVRDLVLDPSGKVASEREHEVDLSQYERTRLRRRLVFPPFEKDGQYEFRTQLKDETRDVWEDVSSIPLLVSIEVEQSEQG